MNIREHDLDRAGRKFETATRLKCSRRCVAEGAGAGFVPDRDLERAAVGEAARANVEMPRARHRQVCLGAEGGGRTEIDRKVFESECRRRTRRRRRRSAAASTAETLASIARGV